MATRKTIWADVHARLANLFRPTDPEFKVGQSILTYMEKPFLFTYERLDAIVDQHRHDEGAANELKNMIKIFRVAPHRLIAKNGHTRNKLCERAESYFTKYPAIKDEFVQIVTYFEQPNLYTWDYLRDILSHAREIDLKLEGLIYTISRRLPEFQAKPVVFKPPPPPPKPVVFKVTVPTMLPTGFPHGDDSKLELSKPTTPKAEPKPIPVDIAGGRTTVSLAKAKPKTKVKLSSFVWQISDTGDESYTDHLGYRVAVDHQTYRRTLLLDGNILESGRAASFADAQAMAANIESWVALKQAAKISMEPAKQVKPVVQVQPEPEKPVEQVQPEPEKPVEQVQPEPEKLVEQTKPKPTKQVKPVEQVKQPEPDIGHNGGAALESIDDIRYDRAFTEVILFPKLYAVNDIIWYNGQWVLILAVNTANYVFMNIKSGKTKRGDGSPCYIHKNAGLPEDERKALKKSPGIIHGRVIPESPLHIRLLPHVLKWQS